MTYQKQATSKDVEQIAFELFYGCGLTGFEMTPKEGVDYFEATEKLLSLYHPTEAFLFKAEDMLIDLFENIKKIGV